jgi:hypothetical protein
MMIKTRLISGALLLALSVSTFASGNLPTTPIPLPQPANKTLTQFDTQTSFHRGNAAYRSNYRRPARRSSKTKAALRIAAPAALGAGIGVLAGGKKGAAAGALIGGGSGAVYHLLKSRR